MPRKIDPSLQNYPVALRVLPVAEVAHRLGHKRCFVHRLATRGLLVRVYSSPASQRSCGITEESLNRFIRNAERQQNTKPKVYW